MTRVLDHDALDAAADRMLGATRIDLAAVHAAARRRARVRRRRAWVGSASAVAAVAASIVLLAGGAVPGVALPPQPEPAAPTGPGEVPDVVRIPPPWTPSATERPLSRVAYAVLDTRPQEPGQLIWLVGADGGEYRSLPSEDPHRLAVSADGSRVAWVEESPKAMGGYGQQAELVKILDVRKGVVRQVSLPGAAGRGFAVEGTAFAPAGHALAVWGRNRVNAGLRTTPELFVVDVGHEEPSARRECRCAAPAFSMGFGLRPDGRLVAVGSLPLGGLPAAPVADAGGVPPGLPPGPITQPPLLAADGRTLYATRLTRLSTLASAPLSWGSASAAAVPSSRCGRAPTATSGRAPARVPCSSSTPCGSPRPR
jgi:hypothetical protein